MESKSGNVLENTRSADWVRECVSHYTGIGTEVRETHVNGQDETKVVVNMPQGLGRYQPEDAVDGLNGVSGDQLAGYRPPSSNGTLRTISEARCSCTAPPPTTTRSIQATRVA